METIIPQPQANVQTSKLLALPLELRWKFFEEILKPIGLHVDLATGEVLEKEGLRFDLSANTAKAPIQSLTICSQIRDQFTEFCKRQAAANATPLIVHMKNFRVHSAVDIQLSERIEDCKWSLPVGDHEIAVRIFLTHDLEINDPAPLGQLVLEIAECQNNGVRLCGFEIRFDRLIVDVDRLKTMFKKVRQTMKTSKRYLRILLRIERAMIVAVRRDMMRAQELEEEAMIIALERDVARAQEMEEEILNETVDR